MKKRVSVAIPVDELPPGLRLSPFYKSRRRIRFRIDFASCSPAQQRAMLRYQSATGRTKITVSAKSPDIPLIFEGESLELMLLIAKHTRKKTGKGLQIYIPDEAPLDRIDARFRVLARVEAGQQLEAAMGAESIYRSPRQAARWLARARRNRKLWPWWYERIRLYLWGPPAPGEERDLVESLQQLWGELL